MLTLGSLFDGIGGWILAAVRNGVKPVWSSEIEDFPMKVSHAHFPDVVQLGDVTKIDGSKVTPVDIICAGSPCQDLSVAGKQKGLAGSRSNLFFESVRIVREMREKTNGLYPKFFVWENVPGAFSSNHGHDFQTVLREIAETDIPMPGTGRWAKAGMVRSERVGIAWRTLDAQFWGVPQRRRRIFLVADFATENRCAAEVLFVEQSVPRNLEKSGTTGKEVAAVAGDSAQASSWCIAGNIINRKDKNGGHHLGVDENVSFTLNTVDQHAVCVPDEKTYSVQAIGHIVESEKSSTLAARDYKSPRNFIEYPKQELASGKAYTGTLLANASTKLWSGNQEAFSGDYFVIDKDKEVQLYDISHRSDGVREISKGAVNALVARMGTGGGNVAVLNEADRQKTDDVRTVRRLTVTECERLQGLPDGYTDVPLNGKPTSEGERLKAIGNGMAQPCADFIISKVVEAFEKVDG